MAEFKGIPIRDQRQPTRSGEKYLTPQGFTAIKDGIKPAPATASPGVRKPSWLRAPLATGAAFSAVRDIVREHRLSTVCEEAKCPNIGECWNAGTATIMLMGAVCTRACRFCAVDTGNPRGWLDSEEPENAARSVELMRLKRRNPGTAVEALTPDFAGVLEDVRTVMDSGLDVFAQNVETVERLTHPVRDPRAGYRQTIDVLGAAKAYRPAVLTKTSLMLGLGETDGEILDTMTDLRAAAVDILTLGQYLRPTPNHLSVERYVTPDQFAQYRDWALDMGFLECVSGPLVRSSYRAEQALARNNVGLANGQSARRSSRP
jgi:lipoyl synthase